MLCRGQTIFLTPDFQFEKRFDFLFVYVMIMCDDILCLPSWYHGKQCKLSWNYIVRFLWEHYDFTSLARNHSVDNLNNMLVVFRAQNGQGV